MRKTKIILLYLSFVSSMVNAQISINGRITDTIGNPISNISVLVHAAGSSSISAYGFSNNEPKSVNRSGIICGQICNTLTMSNL